MEQEAKKGSERIQVAVRVRPQLPHEASLDECIFYDENVSLIASTLTILHVENKNKGHGWSAHRGELVRRCILAARLAIGSISVRKW